MKEGTCTKRIRDSTHGIYSNYQVVFRDGSEEFYLADDLALAIKYKEVSIDNLIVCGSMLKKARGSVIPEVNKTSKGVVSLLASNPRANIKNLMAGELMLAKRKGYKIDNIPTVCGVDLYCINKGKLGTVIIIPCKVTKIADGTASNQLGRILGDRYVTKLKVMGGIGLLDASYMLYNCNYLKEVDFQYFYTSRVLDMSYMFCQCNQLQKFSFSWLNTSKVRNMSSMFNECTSIKDIQLQGIDTSSVINMNSMFFLCSFNHIDVSMMNTCNVQEMSHMFDSCFSLVDLDLSTFSADKLINMDYMLANCESLSRVKFGRFQTNNHASARYLLHNSNRVKLV